MKQVDSILSELDFIGLTTKVVKCLAVHNEEEWVEWNLQNNYDDYDIIRVVEGAVAGRPNSTSDGHSTDRTLEIIRGFPDPGNKIELYRFGRHFKSLEEQKQIFLDASSDGEWLHIVDCDEFYMDGDVAKLKECIRRRPNATEFIPTFLHFYRDFRHIKATHPEWNLWHQRFIRYQKGLRYHTHPVATDAKGVCTYFDPSYQLGRYIVPELFCYHYGHARGKEFHEMKRAFYQSELSKFSLADGMNASQKFDEKYVEFVEYKEALSSILEFNESHPSVMTTHPSFEYHEPFYEGKQLKNWRDNLFYNSELPTIPLLMMGQWKSSGAFYNTMEI